MFSEKDFKSFADLEKEASPKVADVLETLEHYASSGAGICGYAVIRILSKIDLAQRDLREVTSIAELGARVHTEIMGSKRDQTYERVERAEYESVLRFAQAKLSAPPPKGS